MGYPATGVEQVYRNTRAEVYNCLNKYHFNRVKIYNLCIEEDKVYDPNDAPSNISFAHFPMKDHNPASLDLILSFCIDMFLWL